MSLSPPPAFEPLAPEPAKPTRVRYGVLLALALAAIHSYLVRVSLGPATSTVQTELSLSTEQMGFILSGFFWGYIWTQIPGGWLGNRYGARFALALICLLWAIASLWTALAESPAMLRWSRIAAGLAQGGLFPITAKVITDWFPLNRRGIASAVPTGCMSVGSVMANGLTVSLMPVLGWRGVFQMYAAMGVLWSLVFYAWFRNRPEEHPAVNASECKLIRGDWHIEPVAALSTPNAEAEAEADALAPEPPKPEPRPPLLTSLAIMVTSGSMWALCGQSVFRAFGYAFFITWFPSFLERSYGVDVKDAGFLTMLPLLGVVISSPIGGLLADAILTRTGSKWLSRSGLSGLALGLCTLALITAAFMPNALSAVALISLGALCFGVTGPTTWATTMDIGKHQTALIFAIMNICGNIGAIASPILVGYLISHIEATQGDWSLVLYLFAAVYLAAAVCWLILNPNQSAVDRPAVATSSP